MIVEKVINCDLVIVDNCRMTVQIYNIKYPLVKR